MTCVTCGEHLRDCGCPDIDARLRTIAFDPAGTVALSWCLACDRHSERCRCGNRKHSLICGGKAIR